MPLSKPGDAPDLEPGWDNPFPFANGTPVRWVVIDVPVKRGKHLPPRDLTSVEQLTSSGQPDNILKQAPSHQVSFSDPSFGGSIFNGERFGTGSPNSSDYFNQPGVIAQN